MGTCCGTICKHQILFPSIQHLAWLPQGRPQGKQKCGKNRKNINLRMYFKFNREANCNISIQTFICPMCTAMCNLCYIVVCCKFLVYVFWQEVLQYLNNLTKQRRAVCQRRAQFVSDSWASSLLTSDKGEGICFCLCSSVCLSVCVHVPTDMH